MTTPLKIRRATIADFDELSSVFGRFGHDKRHGRSEFFLANIIETQGDKLQMLVALAANTIVGFIVLALNESAAKLKGYDTSAITGLTDSYVVIDLYCMDPAFDSQSHDFMYPSLALFPSAACIIAFESYDGHQPAFLSKFSPVAATCISNTALYYMHKAALIPPTYRKVHDGDNVTVAEDSFGFVAEQSGNPVGFLCASLMPRERLEYFAERFDLGQPSTIAILREFDMEPCLSCYIVDFLTFTLGILNAERFIAFSALPRVPLVSCKNRRLPGLIKQEAPAEVLYNVLHHPTKRVSLRIVVVGASDAGLSFIERLVDSTVLDFTCVTLIAPVDATWSESEYSAADRTRLLAMNKVLVVEARLVAIDRANKLVTLSDDSVLPYDQLVIATGLQEATLNKLGVVTMSVPVTGKMKHINGALSWSEPLLNRLFETGSIFSDSLRFNPISKVIIYGDGVKALYAIQRLLDGKVAGDKITLVRRGEPSDISKRFTDILANLGVEILDQLTLCKFELNQEDRLRACHFENNGVNTRIKCRLIITCQDDDLDVDPVMHAALDAQGIVYDGRLVIDSRFKTCDQRIYACGPIAGFSLRYRKPSMSIAEAETFCRLSGLNSVESGRLAFNAIFDSVSSPEFSEPLIEYGVLPLGLNFISISACARKRNEFSRKIETNTLSDDFATGCLFSIDVDKSLKISKVTFLGSAKLEIIALRSLIGIPVTFLNCLVEKVDCGDVPDILSYLSGDWALGIFHDKFADLKKSVKEGKPVRQEIEKFLENNRNTLNVYYQN